MSSSSRRTLVLVAAMVAVLLVGAAAGMLITTARGGGEDAAPGPDSIDVGFAQDMRVHHLQAVTMAGIERDNSTDPLLTNFAFDVESTQLAQSSEMAGWLTVWGQPQLPDPGTPYMTWMSGGTHAHSDGGGGTATGAVRRMPGMATSDELDKLRKLRGKELDVFFLQLMLRHHEGGLEMAQYAADHASKGYVRNLANKIVSSQANESAMMKDLLAERGAEPLPSP